MMNTNTKIFVTNLGMYNEGELYGAWLSLPVDEDDFEEFLKDKVGIGSTDEFGQPYEEYFITDYDSDLNCRIGEYENVMALSELIEDIERDCELDAMNAYFESHNDNLQEAYDAISSGDYMLISGVSNEEELGEYMFEECGYKEMLVNMQDYYSRMKDIRIGIDYAEYIDFEKFGRHMSENGSFTKYGYFKLY